MERNRSEKKIMIRVCSRRIEISAEMSDPNKPFPPAGYSEEAAEPETIELVTEGRLISEGGRSEIRYEEGEAEGLGGSVTSLMFDEGEPDSVIMMRRGSVSVTMVFAPGLRHICRYDNPIMSLELTLMTHSLENKLLLGGKLSLDYTTELAGISRARNRMTFAIREITEE